MSELLAFVLGICMCLLFSLSIIMEESFSKAQEMCKNNGGLEHYASNTIGHPDIVCKNGAKFILKEKG
jgi:hypothetical protein